MRKNLTPAQQQYYDLKKKYRDCVLFFRMWDFYEVFNEDARICSKLLDIALTSRDKNSQNSIPMAWVPYHSSEKYVSKLVKAWYKVAVAEQIWDVKPWQLVERDVTEVITPWTFIEEKNNKDYKFIWSIFFTWKQFPYHIAWWDFSIGEYFTKSFASLEEVLKFLQKFSFAEIVIDVDFPQRNEIEDFFTSIGEILINISWLPDDVEVFLKDILNVQNLSWYWKALENWRKQALSILLGYLKDVKKTSLKNISKVSYYWDEEKLILDDVTIRNLEIFKSSYEWSKKHSLLWVIDNTQTSMWGRLLYHILMNPSKNLEIIKWRLKWIQYFFENQDNSQKIKKIMKWIVDIPRIISNIVYRKNSPNIFNKLKFSLRNIFSDNLFLKELQNFGLDKGTIDSIHRFYEKLENALKDEWYKEDIDFIKEGFDNEVDELIKTAYHSDSLLIDYQKYLLNYTWLQNIKLKYINNQWYFIELTKKDVKTFEDKAVRGDQNKDFVRRQTLKSVERYTTPYLESLEREIIWAKEKLQKIEKKILTNFADELQSLNFEFFDFCEKIWWLDIFSSMWIFVKEKSWSKPEIGKFYETQITNWTHPVIEEFLYKDQNFVPNNLEISKDSFLHIITWPNMWGKSTFLRQNAIIVLLAHCGLWIPAESGKISLIDWIFARVGSGDVLAKNQSTFMTEMLEMANILHNASSNSFIVLDELWRWTSTYDGLALANAITEYIAESLGAKTLFATHYHEMTGLKEKINGIENFSVAVYETDKEVVFLKKIVKGWASKSYWLDVAKLAWIPNEVLDSAKQYLNKLEQSKSEGRVVYPKPLFEMKWSDERVGKYKEIKKQLEAIDIKNMTPLQAMQIIDNLKNLL